MCGCCALTFPNTRLSDDIMEHKYDQRLQRQHCEHFNQPNFEVHKFSSCLSIFLFALIQRIRARSDVTNSACLIVRFITNLGGRPPPQATTLITKVHKLKLATTRATLPHLCNILKCYCLITQNREGEEA